MKNKVLYISIFFLFSILNYGYSQKVSLILLPAGSTETQTEKIYTEKTVSPVDNEEIKYTRDTVQLTPEKNKHRKNSDIKERKGCKIIGSFCLKKWSKGLIKLFSLPSASGIKL